jgi:RNA polymerase sigma-70 factor (ECF subfamily)
MDDAAFDAFYGSHVRRLVSQLYTMTGDLAEAQDCVQDAFVKAWMHRRRLEIDGNPEAWVRTAAWRIAVSRWRRSTATLRAYRRHGLPPDAAEPQPPDTALADALRALVPEQRRAVVLHYLCDLPVAAIAAETGAQPGTVRVRLSRGRAALAERLGSPDDLAAKSTATGTIDNRTSTGRAGPSREAPHG